MSKEGNIPVTFWFFTDLKFPVRWASGYSVENVFSLASPQTYGESACVLSLPGLPWAWLVPEVRATSVPSSTGSRDSVPRDGSKLWVTALHSKLGTDAAHLPCRGKGGGKKENKIQTEVMILSKKYVWSPQVLLNPGQKPIWNLRLLMCWILSSPPHCSFFW